MKSKISTIVTLLIILTLYNVCMGQNSSDSLIAKEAYRYLKKANTANGVSVTFGLASNLEMLIIGGFPLEVDDGLNPAMNVTHMILAMGRVISAPIPIGKVSKANKVMEPWRASPETHAVSNAFFKKLDAAKALTIVAPVLTVTGGVMMLAASTSTEYYYNDGHETGPTLKRPGLKTTGWIFVGTGLAASISSAVLIGQCKRELADKYGSFTITAGPSGAGLLYNLPNHN